MNRLHTMLGMLLVTFAGCTTLIEAPDPKPGDDQAITVRGHLAEGTQLAGPGLAGKGTLAEASRVVVSLLGADGKLTQVAVADVENGRFDVPIANTMDPGEVLVLQVENIGGALLGSTVLNGVPAFFKGFLIDVPIDTATSFKTEVLLTIANGGVPGIQNYLNVVNTFVDAELAGSIAVFNAFVLDFNSIFGAFAGAAIATEGLIGEQLEAAGFPFDTDAITSAQMMALSGIQGQVTTAAGTIVTDTKNFIAQLQAATRNAAAPLDAALFDVIVGGSAMFKSTFTTSMAAKTAPNQQQAVSFAVVKSGFKLQAGVARDQIDGVFLQANVSGDAMVVLANANTAYADQVERATSVQDLDAAKATYKTALLGEPNTTQGSLLARLATAVLGLKTALANANTMMNPLGANLKTTLTGSGLTTARVTSALATFDAGAQDLPGIFGTVTTDQNASALAKAMQRTEKVVRP